MNTDIRLSVDFWKNHKTKKLERRLGLEGVKSLQILWLWAATNRPNGILSNMTGEDIECDAEWTGEPDVFINTLVDLRWIDVVGGIYILHDWAENNEWASQAEIRADKARFSRLAQVNPDIYYQLKEQGVTAINREEYEKLTAVKRLATVQPAQNKNEAAAEITQDKKTEEISDSLQNETATSVEPISGDSTANASVEPAPAPFLSCSLPSPFPTSSLPEPEPYLSSSTPPAQRTRERDFSETENGKHATLNQVLAIWNEILAPLNFPKALKSTPARERAFKARLNALSDRLKLEWWQEIFKRLASSEFMLKSAKNKANWLTFDWLLNENNLVKVQEGKYDNKPDVPKREPPHTYEEAMERYNRKRSDAPKSYDEAIERYQRKFQGDFIDVEASDVTERGLVA